MDKQRKWQVGTPGIENRELCKTWILIFSHNQCLDLNESSLKTLAWIRGFFRHICHSDWARNKKVVHILTQGWTNKENDKLYPRQRK